MKESTYTYDRDSLSDLFKDVYGIRPGVSFFARWDDSTEDGKQSIWDDLCESVAAVAKEEREAKLASINRFEENIRMVQETVDFENSPYSARVNAIACLIQAEPRLKGYRKELDYAEHLLDLPYWHLRKEPEVSSLLEALGEIHDRECAEFDSEQEASSGLFTAQEVAEMDFDRQIVKRSKDANWNFS